MLEIEGQSFFGEFLELPDRRIWNQRGGIGHERRVEFPIVYAPFPQCFHRTLEPFTVHASARDQCGAVAAVEDALDKLDNAPHLSDRRRQPI